MTERCQTKFTEKFENTNFIIYFGVISASLAILYIYRFHFVVITLSYVLGCVACYYGLKSNILYKYMQQLKYHFVSETVEIGVEIAPIKGCATCGSKDCARHNPDIPVEPWVGLQLHKQLDQAIEDFYNTILDQFINSWYSKITLQPFFVDELRYQLRYASACLLRRAVKINFAEFLVSRLVPCALRHYCACAGESGTVVGAPPLPRPHPAASCRRAEITYLRCVTDAIMPYLLSPSEVNNSVFRVLIREIFAGWVLLSLTDVLADPHILNTLVVLATGDETMAQLPASPNYKVEFLETFARRTESVYIQRSRLLRVELEQVIDDQEQFYAFVQYLKAASHIHLLLFYKDIKLFQTKLLNPELGVEEQAFLYKEACELYDLYLSPHSPNRVPLEAHIVDELNQLLQAPDTIKRLQTSRALYLAAGQAHAVLERVMLPKFLHSQEYYELVIGSRTPTGYQKQMTKKPQDKLLLTALKLGNKLKGALRPQAIDGHVLECLSNVDVTDGDGENMDILKYLDALAAEEGLREQDLSTYKVVLTDVDARMEDVSEGENMDILKYLDALAAEEGLRKQDLSTYKVVLTDVDARMQAPPRRGPVRVFTLGVHRGAAPPRFWTLQRSEHDFHLLRAKLAEFHGDRLPPLPSRRDNSPMETLRYKYEDFLQRLLQRSLLQTSELLHLFLTVDSDFSVVVQASTMNANSNDIGNIYQSVAHKLRKEKGQHLESFLRNFLVSSDMDRYQALKQGTARDVEEAQEMSEDIEVEPIKRPRNARNFIGPVFGDNFGVEPTLYEAGENKHQTVVVGFTQCFMFLLEKVVRAHSLLTAVIGSVLSLMQNMVDDMFSSCLNKVLYNVLSERRLAHLIKLGHGLLFSKKGSTPRTDPDKQRELARSQLMSSIPSSAALITGSSLPTAVHTAFEIIQKPQLNKHLVYNLLDLCLMELFPELNDSTPSEPKS